MSTKEKIPILGSKAVIFQNKYDVWQFSMYVKQARNPNRSNASYHLTKPIKIENLKASFDVYEIQRLALMNEEKVDNKKLAKAI